MSAYGPTPRAPRTAYLPTTIWAWPQQQQQQPASSTAAAAAASDATAAHPHPHPQPQPGAVSLHHTDLAALRQTPPHALLLAHLHAVFADEVAAGTTYPQEDMRAPAAFAAYFCAADVFVAVAGAADARDGPVGGEAEMTLDEARRGRAWGDCVVGFYYVKPNYPGRSSHICNAGFVVPPTQRGHGFGRVLARSYLYYAPRLGYEASVFNLVYANNEPSLRLWERLGFTKAGRIPRAGRLRCADGEGEEYVDAWVIYKSFEDVCHTDGGDRGP